MFQDSNVLKKLNKTKNKTKTRSPPSPQKKQKNQKNKPKNTKPLRLMIQSAVSSVCTSQQWNKLVCTLKSRTSTHGVIGPKINPSWKTIELFLVPASGSANLSVGWCIEKSTPCCGNSRFLLLLSGPLPYVQCHISFSSFLKQQCRQVTFNIFKFTFTMLKMLN